jgi:hypothetical protein
MRKRTVRRVWKLVNPIQMAIEGASITPRKELDRLLVRELGALDDFTHGRASLQQWHDLATVVNLCETLAHEGVGPEALEACGKAQDALIDAARRFTKTQKMGLTGPGLQALRDVIEWHDLQRSSISRSQYERVIKLTVDRVKSGYRVVDVAEVV